MEQVEAQVSTLLKSVSSEILVSIIEKLISTSPKPILDTKSHDQLRDKYVYFFGGEGADGDASMKDFLGGKGANLAEMAKIGLPVPPGFTISAVVCGLFQEEDQGYPDRMLMQVEEALARMEVLFSTYGCLSFESFSLHGNTCLLNSTRL